MNPPSSLRARSRWLPSTCLPLLLVALSSCSESDTSIALRVTNIPAEATELRVLAEVDGQAAASPGSYAPPAAGDSDLRLGVRLLNRRTGQATLDVAACNSACLLSEARTQVDLSQGNAEPTLELIAQPEALDLRLCAPRAAILCSLQWEQAAPTGERLFSAQGAGFAAGATLYADGSRMPGITVAASHRIEFPQFGLINKESLLIEVQNPDRSSILRRLPIAGLPLDSTPRTIDTSKPASQIDRVPFVTAATVADLDRDGHLDIAVTGAFFINAEGTVPNKPGFLAIYWGDGKRGFTRSELVLNLTGIPRAITVGNLKGSGMPQIVIAAGDPLTVGSTNYAIDYQFGGLLSILDPTGPRSYGSAIEVRPTPQFGFRSPHQVLILDVDGDGQNDLVAALSNFRALLTSTYGAVYWWKGSGAAWSLSGIPSEIPKVLLELNDLFPLAMVPWAGPTGNQPGSLALTVYNNTNSSRPQAELRILSNLGAMTPTLVSTQVLGGVPLQLFEGDFSGDGQRDLLVTLPLSTDRKAPLRRIELYPGARVTPSPTAIDLAQPFGLAASIDLFADRRDDLVLSSSKDGIAQLGVFASRPVAPYLGQPAYSLQLLGAGQALLATGDFDKDGKTDLVSVTTGTLDSVSALTSQLDVFFGR
jgi:hypothetical protein